MFVLFYAVFFSLPDFCVAFSQRKKEGECQEGVHRPPPKIVFHGIDHLNGVISIPCRKNPISTQISANDISIKNCQVEQEG